MNPSARQRPPIWRTPLGLILLVASATGAYFLLTGHFDHVLQAVPYLILLACPLMHVFHRGHHGHRDPPPPAAPAPGNEHPPH
jgi:hypothetical protein